MAEIVPGVARQAFAGGVLPHLLDVELEALAAGLAADDLRMVQAATTWPDGYVLGHRNRTLPVEAACPIAYGPWRSGLCPTVGECIARFVEVCTLAGQRGAELIPMCAWLDWWPRAEVWADLLGLVRAEQKRRADRGNP